MGKKSVTPSAATNQPSTYPRDSVYRLDTNFCGIEKLDDVKNLMRQPECHPGCILILNTKSRPATSVRIKTLHFVCSQHRGANVDSSSFKEGKLGKINIKHPTMKAVKTKGTTNRGIVQMAPKNKRKEISQLDSSVNTDPHFGHDEKIGRRTSSNKTSLPCSMQVIIYLSAVDNFYYLSIHSELNHSNHFEMPLNCIPQNVSNLKSNELELMTTMFNQNISSTTIARVLCSLKGKHNTHINPKTLANIQNKTQNILDSTLLGDIGCMNEADKTLLKLRE